MKTAQATLLIELNVSCPYCDYYIELLSETNLNEDGQVLTEAISHEAWKKHSSERINEDVICPKCGKEFNLKGVEW